jgi:phytoene dehydrogenase-like protein
LIYDNAMDYDVIIIGAGHNGLITAGYLAQAGYRVGVFERREIVGGAVSTRELVPGYQIDLGGSAHILIRQTPVVEELELEAYGLRYIDLDPMFVAPFPDGDTLFLYRDLDRTVNHLESVLPGAGEAYHEFVTDWQGFARTMRNLFLSSPSPWNLGKELIFGDTSPLPWHQELRYILRPYEHVLGSYFDHEKLRTMIAWMAAQSGPPPTEPLTGPFALWHPLYHEGGVARPEGGSGMLTQALRSHIEAHGGDVHTGAPVSEILVRDGQARGVRVNGTAYTSRALCSATHARETFMHLLPDEYCPDGAEEMRLGNGFGAMLRLALDEPVSYSAAPGREARTGLQLLCRDMRQLRGAYGEFLADRPSSDPPLVAMTFSAADDTLAPPGGEVLWLWGQYYPYELAGNETWDQIADHVADRMIDQFETYAPSIREHIVGQLFQHPAWLEDRLGLFRGNVMHLEMSIDQMFVNRPTLGLASYRGPVEGLYLTGASTHPGGGIMGASGRNAARTILSDLA